MNIYFDVDKVVSLNGIERVDLEVGLNKTEKKNPVRKAKKSLPKAPPSGSPWRTSKGFFMNLIFPSNKFLFSHPCECVKKVPEAFF